MTERVYGASCASSVRQNRSKKRPAKYILSKGEGTPKKSKSPFHPPLWQRGKERDLRNEAYFEALRRRWICFAREILFRDKYNRKFQLPPARPSVAQIIKARAVVPQDLAPRLIRDPVDLEKRVERLGKGRISVGPVRRDHDIVIAQGFDGINY